MHFGHWKEYYSDGVLKWDGEYEGNDCKKIEIFVKDGRPEFHIAISFEEDTSNLKVGLKYKFRIIAPSVPPSIFLAMDKDCHPLPKNPEDPERFPYLIEPKEVGKYYLLVSFPDSCGNYRLIGSLVYKLNIKK